MLILRKILSKFNSEFNKNFAVLLSGTIVSQVIPVVASIFLARMYTPKDFGLLALFNAIYSILTPIICLRYEFAITLPKKDKDAVNLATLSVFIALVMSVLLVILIVFIKNGFLTLIGGQDLGNYIYLVPVMTFLGGLYSILNYFSVRFKKFKIIATSSILRSFSQSIIQLFFGFIKYLKGGLIWGVVLANFFGNAQMIRYFLSFKHLFKDVSKKRVGLNAYRYKDFPIISSWGVLLNSASLSLNNFFISYLYGVGTLGLYSYGYRYLNMPLGLISNNMGQVFYQQCSECQKNGVNAKSEFLSSLKTIVYISLPFFIILFIIVEDLFAFAFGEAWREAGTYAKILLPLFFARSMFSPLSLITIAFEKQKLTLGMQILIFTFNISSFLAAYIFKLDVKTFLHIYSYASTLLYLILTYFLYLVAIRKI